MEIGKHYYVLTHEGRMFEDILVVHSSESSYKHTLMTTTDVQSTRLYEDYNKAVEHAKHYGLEVKKIRADILGLGSR